jgi:hypothetical protein
MNSLKSRRNQKSMTHHEHASRRRALNIPPPSTHSALGPSLGYDRIPLMMRWL